MHYSIVRYILGMMVKVEAVLMLLPVLVGLIYRVVKIFFGAANLIAKLPIISWINKALEKLVNTVAELEY